MSSSQDFNNFFNSLELLLFVLDVDGNIIYCNDTSCNRLGYTRAELIGMPVVNIHPEEKRIFAALLVDQMLRGEADFCAIPIQCKNGNLIQVETRVSKGSWENKPALFGVTKDVTDIRMIDEKYKTIYDAVPDLIAVIDTEYKIVSVNKSMADKMGLTAEQAIGITCYEAIHGTVCPPELCPNVKLLEEGETHQAEVFEPRLGGNYLVTVSPIHDSKGDITSSVHVAHDITQVRQAEKKFATIFQFAPIAIAITQISDGTIVDVNDAWLYLTGFWKDDVIGRKMYDLHLYEDNKDRDAIVEQLHKTHQVENVPVKMRTRQGKPIYGLFSGQPIMLDGTPCWITSLNNQTNIVLLEQAIIDFKAKIIKASDDYSTEGVIFG